MASCLSFSARSSLARLSSSANRPADSRSPAFKYVLTLASSIATCFRWPSTCRSTRSTIARYCARPSRPVRSSSTERSYSYCISAIGSTPRIALATLLNCAMMARQSLSKNMPASSSLVIVRGDHGRPMLVDERRPIHSLVPRGRRSLRKFREGTTRKGGTTGSMVVAHRPTARTRSRAGCVVRADRVACHHSDDEHVLRELTKAVLSAVAQGRQRLVASAPKLPRGRPATFCWILRWELWLESCHPVT